MARTVADPITRLQIIAAARDQVEAGQNVSADPMAKLLSMSWVNLRATIMDDPQFPVKKQGSEGVQWVFDANAVLDHMALRCNEAITRRGDQQDRLAKLAGVAVEKGSEAFSVADLVKINMVQTAVQRRKIEQRQFVERSAAAAVIADLFTTLQTELIATGSRLDPAGQWPAEVREAVDQSNRSLLVRLHEIVEPWTKHDIRREGPA